MSKTGSVTATPTVPVETITLSSAPAQNVAVPAADTCFSGRSKGGKRSCS